MSEKGEEEFTERRQDRRSMCHLHDRELDMLQNNISSLTKEVSNLRRGKWESRLDIVAKATAPIALLAMSWFMGWSKGVDRDVVRIDTNQRVVMGTIERMNTSTAELARIVNDLRERMARVEGRQ